MLNVIYYSETYNSKHGGSTHAREFFKALSNHKSIKDVIVFSGDIPVGDQPSASNISKNNFLLTCKSFLRYILKEYAPDKLKILYRLNFPSKSVYAELVGLIKSNNADLLIIRHTTRFKYINWLNKDFPSLRLILEYNASPFSENLSDVSFVNHWRKKEIESISHAHIISVVSDYLKQYIISINSDIASKIIINPNGVDIDTFKPLSLEVKNKSRDILDIPTDAIVFGYMGGMEKFRRLPEVVERFAKLRLKGFTKIFLMIIGNGEELEKVLSMAGKYKVAFNNYFYCKGDWIPHEDVPLWLNMFDVGVFPFTAPYCSPLKIFEYSACGIPILGPDIPALTNGTGRELCSRLVAHDGHNFEECVLDIYNNIENENVKAIKRRSIVEQHFTWNSNVSRILHKL